MDREIPQASSEVLCYDNILVDNEMKVMRGRIWTMGHGKLTMRNCLELVVGQCRKVEDVG